MLPRQARSRLRLNPGAKLICEVRGDEIVLRPVTPVVIEHDYVTDEISGLRVVKKSKGAPVLTTDMVKALMADFP